MAYAQNYDWIKEQIRSKGITAYRITNESKNQTFAENDEITPDVVISDLDNILPNLQGLIYLTLSTKSKAEKSKGGPNNGDLTIPVQLSGTNKAMAGIGNMPPVQNNQATIEALEEKFNAKLEMQRLEFTHAQEIAELKRQLAEAKELNPTVKLLEPHLPKFIEGIFGMNKPAIAGHPLSDPIPTEVVSGPQEISAEESARATQAINDLLAIDPDFINVLCRLAKMAKTSPDMYNTAKTMLPPLN